MSSALKSSESKAQPVRGTRDLLGEEKRRQSYVTAQAQQASALFGCEEIETPLFEETGVFYRLGESSDIVTKETYTFEDRGGSSLTLRPEGTAPVARALISNGLTQTLPAKFFYAGPMFRYERPQKGRYRQFTQVGVEIFGLNSYHGDIETIQIAENFLERLGLRAQVSLELNSLGDAASREAYREKLVTYFTRYQNDLSEDSRHRLKQNPLRILDSKDEGDRKLLKDAPLYGDSLTVEARSFFDQVLKTLENLGIQYRHNPYLVRGLDYYCHTAFEYVSTDLGAQGTVLAGGRYDGLVKNLGGPEVSGVGWAAGVDRLALLLKGDFTAPRPVVILPMGDAAEAKSFEIANLLRAQNTVTEILYGGNIGKRLKKATKANAHTALIIGDDDLAQNQAQVRILDRGTEEAVAFDKLAAYIKDITS
ncbi:MAG: histidine--tRNA ligase [Alphaproteobacteria bacterium]|nr:histidine--tRNA ligase [Alphaproteobacteria bacterium]NCQ66603.1 histidine--tRNA ligase [Alphaproteobacteria bacterium]NCT06955.1 histidine--tRNA ligase [Alphaproteobacteria bacterium]